MHLLDGFIRSARTHPDRLAVRHADGRTISYRELDRLSEQVRVALMARGIKPGNRVGVYLPKSIDSVAAILGILKANAVYVPVDPTAPVSRNAYIFGDCDVRVGFTTDAVHVQLQSESDTLPLDDWIVLDGVGDGQSLSSVLGSLAGSTRDLDPVEEDALAYILYTSGSTGKPKGVMISHLNARRFVEWCARTFDPTELDVFSSHAPFHFDLSILDLYIPMEFGAAIALIDESLGKEPQRLAEFIGAAGVTVWYSTPSILSLLVEYGERSALVACCPRLTLFAGEVFPIGQLNALRQIWPASTYYNLYGPTETNVCTYYRLPESIDAAQKDPHPIGQICEHYSGRIVDSTGAEVSPGSEGELLIAGDGVMKGYWGLGDLTSNAFLDIDSVRWYRTGDLVSDVGGNLVYRGRKDRMVKKRGYRVELGEIETCLHGHEDIREAAVIAVQSADEGVSIHAHVSTRSGERLSVIKLKTFCAARLPNYMIPDRFSFHQTLPKTSTDKTDYQTLLRQS